MTTVNLELSSQLQERWRPVVGYEGLYEVSDQGRIKSLRSAQIMKPNTSRKGYQRLTLSGGIGRKHNSVHRIVAKAFIPNPENKATVNHKDGNPSNNRLDNLEWATQQENVIHSFKVLGKKVWDDGKMEKVEITCLVCGKKKITQKSKHQLLCSPSCAAKYSNAKRVRKPKEDAICELCSKPYKFRRREQRFCGRSCASTYKQIRTHQ